MQNNVNCRFKSSAAQPHLLPHLCSPFWSTLTPSYSRQPASPASPALSSGSAASLHPPHLQHTGHKSCKPWGHCSCGAPHPLTAALRAARSSWPHLDFQEAQWMGTLLTSEMRHAENHRSNNKLEFCFPLNPGEFFHTLNLCRDRGKCIRIWLSVAKHGNTVNVHFERGIQVPHTWPAFIPEIRITKN